VGQFKNYYGYIENEAASLVSDFRDEMIEEVEQGNTELYSFFDDHVHYWVDSDMGGCDLIDHAEILEQSEDVESDWGLWEGLREPRKAIEAQAFFTYRGDLMRAVLELAKDFLKDLEEKYEQEVEKLQEELDEFDITDETTEEQYEDTQDKITEAEEKLTNIREAIESY
jgi:gas vesicle protein